MISSSYGNLNVDMGEDKMSFFETSIQETDLGIPGTSVISEEALVFRRLVDIFRHSLPSDSDRDGLKILFSGSGERGSLISIPSSGNDNRGLGFGLIGLAVGRGIVGELRSDSFERNGARAFESGWPISLFDRCTPGRRRGGDKCACSLGSRWTIVAGAIDAVFAIPISPIEPILYSDDLLIDMAAMELALDRKWV